MRRTMQAISQWVSLGALNGARSAVSVLAAFRVFADAPSEETLSGLNATEVHNLLLQPVATANVVLVSMEFFYAVCLLAILGIYRLADERFRATLPGLLLFFYSLLSVASGTLFLLDLDGDGLESTAASALVVISIFLGGFFPDAKKEKAIPDLTLTDRARLFSYAIGEFSEALDIDPMHVYQPGDMTVAIMALVSGYGSGFDRVGSGSVRRHYLLARSPRDNERLLVTPPLELAAGADRHKDPLNFVTGQPSDIGAYFNKDGVPGLAVDIFDEIREWLRQPQDKCYRAFTPYCVSNGANRPWCLLEVLIRQEQNHAGVVHYRIVLNSYDPYTENSALPIQSFEYLARAIVQKMHDLNIPIGQIHFLDNQGAELGFDDNFTASMHLPPAAAHGNVAPNIFTQGDGAIAVPTAGGVRQRVMDYNLVGRDISFLAVLYDLNLRLQGGADFSSMISREELDRMRSDIVVRVARLLEMRCVTPNQRQAFLRRAITPKAAIRIPMGY